MDRATPTLIVISSGPERVWKGLSPTVLRPDGGPNVRTPVPGVLQVCLPFNHSHLYLGSMQGDVSQFPGQGESEQCIPPTQKLKSPRCSGIAPLHKAEDVVKEKTASRRFLSMAFCPCVDTAEKIDTSRTASVGPVPCECLTRIGGLTSMKFLLCLTSDTCLHTSVLAGKDAGGQMCTRQTICPPHARWITHQIKELHGRL